MPRFQISRDRMVKEQLVPRGIQDVAVIQAMRSVPRHLFVDEALQMQSYSDHPLPIGFGQTISQPYMVAMMSQLLQAKKGMRVLEIGTGSGYQAAVLHAMGLEVFSVERLRELYLRATNLFMKMRLLSIRLKIADGTEGWTTEAPFDRIIVTAGGPKIPEPLIDQLAEDGRMLIPVGQEKRGQKLILVHKTAGNIVVEEKEEVAFVDLVGSHAW